MEEEVLVMEWSWSPRRKAVFDGGVRGRFDSVARWLATEAHENEQTFRWRVSSRRWRRPPWMLPPWILGFGIWNLDCVCGMLTSVCGGGVVDSAVRERWG